MITVVALRERKTLLTCYTQIVLEGKNLLTVNRQKRLSAFLHGAAISVFLSVSLVERGTPRGRLYRLFSVFT